jgi:hypothetical protein
MVTFYDFRANIGNICGHLRTSNLVKSPFAAVRLRTAAA